MKVSVARYVAGQGLAAASITDNNNPENTVGLTDRAPGPTSTATDRRSRRPAPCS